MIARRGFRVFTLSVLTIGLFSNHPLHAQVAPTSVSPAEAANSIDIENSKFQAVGSINSNAVYVRSGASDNDYPTMKLDKGAQVTVVGEKFNWLKILPPPGSFCLVSQAYVNRAGNGSVGVVTTAINVRTGSLLNALKSKIARPPLEPNQRVEIIGEQDEYYKIKPPADVYLYVNKQFVDLVKVVGTDGNAPPAPAPGPTVTVTPQPGGGIAPRPEIAPGMTTTPPVETVIGSTTQPSNPGATAAGPAATQPSAAAEAEFDRLETIYATITQKPLDEQPVEELLADYQKLSAMDGLPESLRRISDFKVSVLKGRAEVKAQFVATKQVQEEMRQRTMALRSEQNELEQRVKDAELKFFTAVGTLRTSSLQVGQQVMYRLTDPANGRTVVYLRSNDGKLASMLGQFIGVKGDVSTDAQNNLRTVTAETFEVVNPAKIGQSVAAQICPPSLLPGTASTAD